MLIENSFTVDAPIETAWAVMTDIPTIAPCLPGAVLEGQDGDSYTGKMKVKVGPVTAEYKGAAEFVEKDDAAHKAVIHGKGRDSRGQGNAEAMITAQMATEGTGTRIDISTDLKITGKVAQFGRGVMQDVSEKLLGQFAECLEGKLASGGGEGDAAGSDDDGQTAAAAPAVEPEEVEALDLLEVAGGSVAKRAIPVIAGLIAVGVLFFVNSILAFFVLIILFAGGGYFLSRGA